jgi:HAMP domain-containing protein
LANEFDQLSRKILITAVAGGMVTAAIAIGGAGLVVWKVTDQHTMRIEAIERRLEQSDERERKVADRLSELGTDIRWIRRELEKQSAPR